jgi:hypothetical protein
MMLSRKAVDALVDHARQKAGEYTANPLAKGIGDPETIYDVFQVGVKNSVYLSEDYWACNTLLDLGFEIFVDRSIATRHHGMRSYTAQ